MLLWLTLALLWSPTYWAGETFGPGGGTYFHTSRDFQNNVTGIQVFTGRFGCVRSGGLQMLGPGSAPRSETGDQLYLLRITAVLAGDGGDRGPGIGGVSRSFKARPSSHFPVRHGSSWSHLCGAEGLNPQQFHLQKGEHISGSRLLQAFLLLGRSHQPTALRPFWMSTWPLLIASPDDSQKELTGVYAQYTVQGITSIGFEWGYPSS
ncbi:zymogen granule protein 16 homolog B-like [Bos javanicus]|uniref:zymogen granule protein 16 homolog B-like n=1 Tax=Bos javanicus TaxID=9906 RepID=UPI002AA72FB6|nr:zymogen granule protein 16 homolog B-like [Bos javanicus]